MTTLSTFISHVDQLVGQYKAREARRAALATEVTELEGSVALLSLTDLALTTLLQQTSEANLKAVEELITAGLQAVFEDLSLSFHFSVEQSRAQQSLTPLLASHGVVEGPLLESHGGGPAQLVAVLLRILTVHRLGLARLVLLDESLGMVAARYVPACARFLTGLCERLDLDLLLVTHQPEFIGEATRAYEISSGPQGAVFQQVT